MKITKENDFYVISGGGFKMILDYKNFKELAKEIIKIILKGEFNDN